MTKKKPLQESAVRPETCSCRHDFAHEPHCPFWPNVRDGRETLHGKKETLAQKRLRLDAKSRAARKELHAKDTCVVVFNRQEEDVRDGYVKEVVDDNIFVVCAGREYVFSAVTHKCLIPINKNADVFTLIERKCMELFREEVIPKLEDLARDYKNSGDMTLEEIKALSAVLQLATNQREGKR